MGERSPLVLEPLRRTVGDAQVFANVAHDTQVDKSGEPYINHLWRVTKAAQRMASKHGWSVGSSENEEIQQIAWLHDVIEDTPYGGKGLLREGFSIKVIRAVEMLSKPKHSSQPYAEWIALLAENADLSTLLVKIADVEDNSDPARLALLPAETRARLEKKYGAALPVLRAAAERLGWKEEKSNVR